MAGNEREQVPENRFTELLSRLEQGDSEASEQIVAEYGSHILRAVRRRMSRSIRDRFDSQDFAQAVWASFFGHISVVQKIGSQGELAGFLAKMASNKVIDQGRRDQVRATINQADNNIPAVEKDHRTQMSQPTPSQFAVANEQWERLTGDEGQRDQDLLRLRRDGATHEEIARQMGVSDRHIRRILRRFERKQASDHESAVS